MVAQTAEVTKKPQRQAPFIQGFAWRLVDQKCWFPAQFTAAWTGIGPGDVPIFPPRHQHARDLRVRFAPAVHWARLRSRNEFEKHSLHDRFRWNTKATTILDAE
jgi:hypothetical protein